MSRKKSVLLLVCCFIFSGIFGQAGFNGGEIDDSRYLDVEVEDSEVSAGHIKENRRETSLTINSNVFNGEIYLNGRFAGYTNSKIRGLHPGMYFVEIVKPGYEKESVSVYLRRGEEQTLYVYLKLITGYIEFLNYPSGASVFVDGLITTGKVYEVGIGSHSVLVKSFGYKDLNTYVTVNPHETTALNIELEEADFEISSFIVSRNTINPNVSGLSSTVFTFIVTADQPAIVTVNNSTGNVVRTFEYSGFTTWSNTGIWNGRDENGDVLPSGKYVLKISGNSSAENKVNELSTVVYIDDEMTYTLRSFTLSGGGIGTLPAAFHTTMANIIPAFGIEPVIGISNSSGITDFGCVITSGVLFGIGKYVEGGVLIGGDMKFVTNPYEQAFPFFGNFSVKASGSIAAGKAGYFNFGGLVRYGFSTEEILGCGERGLGGGLILGFESPLIYAGLSSEYLFGVETGSVIYGSRTWKNGIALSFTPADFMRLNGWVSLSLNNNINFGLEYMVMPGGRGFSINLSTSVTEYMKDWICNATYISEKIILSYSF